MFSVASAARVPATLGAPRVSLRASARRGASVKARAFGSWKKAKPEEKAPKLDENGDPVEEDGIDFTGLKQLISMGLGTISGDITEINLDDPARTVVMVRACVRACARVKYPLRACHPCRAYRRTRAELRADRARTRAST